MILELRPISDLLRRPPTGGPARKHGVPALDALEHFGVCVMSQNPRLAGIGRHPRPAQNSVNLSELPVKVPGVIGLGDHPRRVASTATHGPGCMLKSRSGRSSYAQAGCSASR